MTKKTPKHAPKKKPVTMAERVKRIELDVNRHAASMVSVNAAMREKLDAVHRTVVTRHDATHAAVGRLAERLDRIEGQLSLILSGQSFMQELEQARPTKEQGLQPVEPEPWKPSPGDWAVVLPQDQRAKGSAGCTGQFPGHPINVLTVKGDHVKLESGTWSGGPYCSVLNLRPATPEEVAKYRADQAAKPIVPYETKVMFLDTEWRVVHGPDSDGDYSLHRVDENGYNEWDVVERHQFTVIP